MCDAKKLRGIAKNLITSLLNPNLNPNPMLSGQVESEKTGLDLHH
jgi:hypothetical protein